MLEIRKLPEDVIYIIYSWIPKTNLIHLNKNNYSNNHYLITTKFSNINKVETFTRKIIRNDWNYVFKIILNENFDKWMRMKKYIYASSIFENYIFFLLYFANENNSSLCKEIIKEKIQVKVNKKWHKNIKLKYYK